MHGRKVFTEIRKRKKIEQRVIADMKYAIDDSKSSSNHDVCYRFKFGVVHLWQYCGNRPYSFRSILNLKSNGYVRCKQSSKCGRMSDRRSSSYKKKVFYEI